MNTSSELPDEAWQPLAWLMSFSPVAWRSRHIFCLPMLSIFAKSKLSFSWTGRRASMACRKKKPKQENQSFLIRFEGTPEIRLGKCSCQQDSVDTSEKDPPCLDSSLRSRLCSDSWSAAPPTWLGWPGSWHSSINYGLGNEFFSCYAFKRPERGI